MHDVAVDAGQAVLAVLVAEPYADLDDAPRHGTSSRTPKHWRRPVPHTSCVLASMGASEWSISPLPHVPANCT